MYFEAFYLHKIAICYNNNSAIKMHNFELLSLAHSGATGNNEET